jgi:DNA-binding CsgD family transcriptional regulator
MTTGLDALTAKEKDALRLLLRGHDAKSSARELGLSVHTVNERLRDARRKLGVTSSREAARRLLAEENDTPENLGDTALGDASAMPSDAPVMAPASQRWARFGLGPGLALTLAGVLAMSLILAALFLPASPLSVMAPAMPALSAAATAEAEAASAARALPRISSNSSMRAAGPKAMPQRASSSARSTRSTSGSTCQSGCAVRWAQC